MSPSCTASARQSLMRLRKLLLRSNDLNNDARTPSDMRSVSIIDTRPFTWLQKGPARPGRSKRSRSSSGAAYKRLPTFEGC